MEKTAEQTPDFLQFVAWTHAHRRQLIAIGVAILVIGAGIGFYVWHKNSLETDANDALSNIKFPVPARPGVPAPPADPQPYVALANEYAGTSAASRALLLAAESYFDAGKFDQAQAQFGRFLSDYPDSPLANEASLGIAACLEGQGKFAEAASRYDDILRRNAGSSILPQAKSALARLDVALNKPEEALRLYEEMVKTGNSDSWTAEAQIQAEELIAKYPNLKKPTAPPAQPAPPAGMTMSPPLQMPPAATNKPASVPAKPVSPSTNK